MKKTRVVLLVIVIAIAAFTTIYIEFFPFGYKAKEIQQDTLRLDNYNVNKDIPNTSIYSYRVKEKFNDKTDVIDFLKKYEATNDSGMYSLAFDLGNFKDTNGDVIWEDVYNSIKVEYKLWKKMYKLDYKTSNVECNGNSISITKDGYILDYRSSGK